MNEHNQKSLEPEGIVISGIAGKFASANDIEELRKNLFDKVDMVSADFGIWQGNPELPKKLGKMLDLEKFDLGYFGITSTQSDGMEPSARIILEKAVEAIADSGSHPSDFYGTNTGVFAASALTESEKTIFFENLEPSADGITGCHRSMFAKWLSYHLGLKGPAYQVDTACSSVMFALVCAYQAMKTGACDKAFICTGQLCLDPVYTRESIRYGTLSPEGRSKSFDDSANGYARSEAAGVILLERAKDAKRVYAEVVHIMTNHDGFKEEGISALSSRSIKALVDEFYLTCQVDPGELTYVEAHGTGTRVGDIQELLVLDHIYKKRSSPLYFGSIKSNIGHAESASGLCAIAKTIIAMESGYIPPNIHFKTPRRGVPSFENGEMILVTEKTPLPNQNGLMAADSSGFGGVNTHLLLRWNSKTKVDGGKPKDKLPRLICVSSRVKEGVESILEEFFRSECDAEYAYLVQQAFRKAYDSHIYRGYGICGVNGDGIKSFKRLEHDKSKLKLIFGDSDKRLWDCCEPLMAVPSFSATMESIRDVIFRTVGIDIFNVTPDSEEFNLRIEILRTVAFQTSIADTLKAIQLKPDEIVGVGCGDLAAGYYVERLSLEQVIFASIWHQCNSLETYTLLTRSNEEDNGSKSKFCCTSSRVAAREQGIIENEWIQMSIGGTGFGWDSSNTIHLINDEASNYFIEFLTCLGRLYEFGFEMEIDQLYPPLQLPVSRGTPMLSSLIKWQHNRDCKVSDRRYEIKTECEQDLVHITTKSKWSYITGHVLGGRNLFPAAAYLALVLETFAKVVGKNIADMRVAFENVQFLRVVKIQEDESLDLMVTVQPVTRRFEVSEGNNILATGTVYEEEFAGNTFEVTAVPEEQLSIKREDFYREFKLRGHDYSGGFQDVRMCDLEATRGVIDWNDNWTTYLDCAMQLMLFGRDTRDIGMTVSLQYLAIDGPEHYRNAANCDNAIPVSVYREIDTFQSPGVEIRCVEFFPSTGEKKSPPVLEKHQFVSNRGRIDRKNSIRSLIQLVLENTHVRKVNVMELCPKGQRIEQLLYADVQSALDDVPLVVHDITVLTNQSVDLPNVKVEDATLRSKKNCLILVVSNLLETVEEMDAVNAVKASSGFIISRESRTVDLTKFLQSPFNVLCAHSTEEEVLVLLRLQEQKAAPKRFLDFSNAVENFKWLYELQNILKSDAEIMLYTQGERGSGVLGFTNCLRKEYKDKRIGCIFIADDAPEFDPELEFYKEQLSKNLAVNVWKDGSWGTYRHLPVSESQTVNTPFCYLDASTKGDRSKLEWMEGNAGIRDLEEDKENIVEVYYSAVNFKDSMVISSNLSPGRTAKNRTQGRYFLGTEFAGRNSRGERVLGYCSNGPLATSVKCEVFLPIPDMWTMEDASTILVAYGSVVKILFMNFNPKPGETILIHSATTDVGQAALNLCLHFGLNIFVTVETQAQCEFLFNNYPQLNQIHIGNPVDASFEETIYRHTEGRGVDYVLIPSSEATPAASIRCLARGGKLLAIGKQDVPNSDTLSLQLLEKEAQMIALNVGSELFGENCALEAFKEKMADFIERGCIRPLHRTTFDYSEVEEAFRYMDGDRVMGKVLIKMREDEDRGICLCPQASFKAFPRFYCNPEHSYVLCGGLGGFGLELADWLILRGARRLVLTSKSGISNGYQRYRLRLWKKYGATVLVNNLDASTEEGCTELLRTATELGPVACIINLAGVLRDGHFEELNVEDFRQSLQPKYDAVRNLDKISRRMCPNLRHFVTFSSYSCGRGNEGQTNYGLSNSLMERVCEQRRAEGYPGLAIQWGAIKEVGMVARMIGSTKEKTIQGTSPQKMSSCLQVLDELLTQNCAVVSSMVVAQKKTSTSTKSLFEIILKMIGITNVRSINPQATLPELGLDSIGIVEIKQVLERDCELSMKDQDMKTMTLGRLKTLTKNQQFSVAETPKRDSQQDSGTFVPKDPIRGYGETTPKLEELKEDHIQNIREKFPDLVRMDSKEDKAELGVYKAASAFVRSVSQDDSVSTGF